MNQKSKWIAGCSAPPLVVRLGALGDTVRIAALMDALARRYGQPCDVLGSPWAREVYGGGRGARQIQVIANKRVPYLLSPEQRRAVRWLRRRGPGPVFLLDTLPRIRDLLARAGIPGDRIVTISPSRPDDPRNALDRIMELARRAPDAPFPMPEPADPAPKLSLSDADLSACRVWMESRGLADAPYLVIQPGTSRTLKRKADPGKKFWPTDRWVETIHALQCDEPGLHILINGAPREAALTDALAKACGGRTVSVARGMTVPRLTALLSKAAGCISVDTGPAHIAAAVGCPLVVLYGGTWPRRLAPLARGAPVRIVTGPPGAPEDGTEAEWLLAHSMEDIPVRLVTEAARSIFTLEGDPPWPR